MSTSACQDHVVRRALERLGSDPSRTISDVAAGSRDGGAGDGGDPAGDGAHPEADHAGVASHHDDALGRHAKLGRTNLGERGLVRLALGGDSDEELDGPVGVDPDVGALERTDPRAFDVRREAEPDRPAAPSPLLLLLAPSVVIQTLEDAVEGRRIIRRVVDDRHTIAIRQARPVRHRVRPDGHATPRQHVVDRRARRRARRRRRDGGSKIRLRRRTEAAA